MPVFGVIELLIAALIVYRWASFPALIGVGAISVTMLLRPIGIEFLPYASAVWSIAGMLLIMLRFHIIGALYGLSGIVYLLGYAGLEDSRYAVIHILSDVSFLAGLVFCVWPRGGVAVGRNIRRFILGFSVVKMAKYTARRETKNEFT
jgi:hypothetical protein